MDKWEILSAVPIYSARTALTEPPPMPFLVLLLFLLPFLEIYSLIVVGSHIGVFPTIALVLALSLFGAYLLRVQGFAALFKAQAALARGEMPVAAMLDGVGLTIAAGLLIAPGFITEAMGFALLVPPMRRWAMQWAMGRLLKSHTFERGKPASPGPKPGRPGPADVIEGDFKRLDE